MNLMKVAATFTSSLAVVAAIAFGQNPNTVCATIAQVGNESPYACAFNGCNVCHKQSWESGGYTYTNCNCGGVYSSACCNVAVGENGAGTWTAVTMGSCKSSQGCGNDGGCGLVPQNPENPENGFWIAVCQM